jgi:hypothetical protein
VFIDFQKAFDMLWKHGLLQKMVSLNIYGNMLSYVNGIIPRNLTSLIISSICVPIFKTNLPKFRFLEKIIPTVLFGDNKNPHVEHHLLILSMRLLTGTKWGANSYTLRTIYFALIRTKIDYGCEVYNSASHAVKKLLDNIQQRLCY